MEVRNSLSQLWRHRRGSSLRASGSCARGAKDSALHLEAQEGLPKALDTRHRWGLRVALLRFTSSLRALCTHTLTHTKGRPVALHTSARLMIELFVVGGGEGMGVNWSTVWICPPPHSLPRSARERESVGRRTAAQGRARSVESTYAGLAQ